MIDIDNKTIKEVGTLSTPSKTNERVFHFQKNIYIITNNWKSIDIFDPITKVRETKDLNIPSHFDLKGSPVILTLMDSKAFEKQNNIYDFNNHWEDSD